MELGPQLPFANYGVAGLLVSTVICLLGMFLWGLSRLKEAFPRTFEALDRRLARRFGGRDEG